MLKQKKYVYSVKPDLLGTNFSVLYVQNRQVFGLYRFPSLELYLRYGLYRILVYSGFFFIQVYSRFVFRQVYSGLIFRQVYSGFVFCQVYSGFVISSPGQRPCELLPSGFVRRLSLAFHILIFSSETTEPI